MGVYKEGKNWKVQVYYKDWQGNQKRKQKRGFRTKGEAKEWERDFLQQQSQGVDIEFGNFLEIYYKDMDVRLREHTMYTKRYIIDLKIRPYFEKKILSEITVADVRAWQNELLMYKDKNGKGYSQTYLKTINCQLTAIFNYAIRYYNLQDNPCRKAGAIGKSKGEPKDFWMQEEFNDFLETVSDKPETRMAFLVILQDLFHGPGVTGAGRLDYRKGQRLPVSGLLHSAIPPVSFVLMVSSALVLCRWTALRDIPTTAPISLSVSSRTQCSIRMLCPG